MEYRIIPIKGFPGYKIDTNGVVWSSKEKIGNQWHIGKNLTKLKYSWAKNYLKVTLVNKNKAHSQTVHSLVLLNFIGERPEGLDIRHLDGNPLNNSLANLKWGTKSENQQDRVKHGTSLQGEKHYFAILNTEKVKLARLLYFTFNWKIIKIYNLFNLKNKLTFSSLSMAIHGKNWKHLPNLNLQ